MSDVESRSNLLTVRELASMMGVSRYTIYERIKDGSLGIPVIKELGPRSMRFARENVAKFIGNLGVPSTEIPFTPPDRLAKDMTVREYFAAMAMVGLLGKDPRTAADFAMGMGAMSSNKSTNDALARGAVHFADALIEALNK